MTEKEEKIVGAKKRIEWKEREREREEGER